MSRSRHESKSERTAARSSEPASARPAARLLRPPGRAGRAIGISTTPSDASTAQGAEIVDLDDPVDFEQVLKDHRTVMAAEAARRALRLARRVSRRLSSTDPRPDPRRPIARRRWITCRPRIAHDRDRTIDHEQRSSTAKLDALITPATVGPAPDPSTTGDPAFNSPWSYTGPPDGLVSRSALRRTACRVAIQLVGRFQLRRSSCCRSAEWCEHAIRTCAAVKGSSPWPTPGAQRLARRTGPTDRRRERRRPSSAPGRASKRPCRASSSRPRKRPPWPASSRSSAS